MGYLIRACHAVVLGMLSLSAGSAIHAAEAGNLTIGTAKLDITPANFNGFYSVWATRFTAVHDPIFVRTVVLDNGITRAAIVATDLVEFGDTTTLRQRIERELGIPADHIMIAASHDHNAPRAGPIVAGSSSADGRPYSPPAYVQYVDDRVVEALRQSKAALRPGRVGIGTAKADINVNRNGFNGRGFGGPDPEGPSDKTVWVVKFESLTGESRAILMNYGVHSVVAGSASTLLTGDLAGAAERYVERHYGPQTIALWTMGPAGDQNPKYMSDAKQQDEGGKLAFEAMDAQGLLVGVAAIQAADRITRMTSSASLAAGESVFSCAMIPPRPPRATAGPSPFAPNPDFKQVIERPAAMDIHLGLIRINDIAITGVSGEVFTRIFWHLKQESPLVNTFMVTMSNGRIGYIGDDASYAGPFTNPSVVQGCAEQGIVDGLVGLMERAR